MVSQKISKEVFVEVIEHLHQQYLQDKEYVEGISAVFGVDMPLYDNSHLLKSSLELLRVFFPKDEEGFCDIEHFCYVCEFGKIGEVKDAEELWGVLVGRVKPDCKKSSDVISNIDKSNKDILLTHEEVLEFHKNNNNKVHKSVKLINGVLNFSQEHGLKLSDNIDLCLDNGDFIGISKILLILDDFRVRLFIGDHETIKLNVSKSLFEGKS